MDNELYVKVLGHLQAQCSRKECCSADMRAKALKAMDGDEDAAQQIVASLVSDRFVMNCVMLRPLPGRKRPFPAGALRKSVSCSCVRALTGKLSMRH